MFTIGTLIVVRAWLAAACVMPPLACACSHATWGKGVKPRRESGARRLPPRFPVCKWPRPFNTGDTVLPAVRRDACYLATPYSTAHKTRLPLSFAKILLPEAAGQA
jgi:hypothetical protein